MPAEATLQDFIVTRTFYKRYATAWTKAHGAREETLQGSIARFFREQGETVVAGVRHAGEGLDPVGLANKLIGKSSTKRLLQYVERPLFMAMVSGAQLELAAFGVSKKPKIPADAPKALENTSRSASGKYLPQADLEKAESGEEELDSLMDLELDMPDEMVDGLRETLDDILDRDYWSEIAEDTKAMLANRLKQGIESGYTMREITAGVSDLFDGMEKWRALRIARTETTMALNAGQHATREVLIDEGIIDGSEWFATADMKTRDTHVDADGQRIGPGELFDIGGHPAQYPGDPDLPAEERVHCRCVAVATTAFTDKAAVAAGMRASGHFCGRHSKREYERDERGQFAETDSGGVATLQDDEATLVSGELFDRLKRTGGFTYQPIMRGSPTKGFALSVSRENEEVFSGDVTPNIIKGSKSYIQSRPSAFANPTAHIGGWYDAAAGKTYLDVSIISDDKDTAVALAREHGQEGVFDLGTGTTIIVKDEAERRKQVSAVRLPAGRNGRGDRGGAGELAEQWGGVAELIAKAFCPTGPGGGVDNSCGGDGEGGSDSGDSGERSDGHPDAKGISDAIRAEPVTEAHENEHVPDVYGDANGDGITDSCRVGVPANEVPPPPSIPRMPNLTPDERAVEESFAKQYEDDPKVLLDGYAAFRAAEAERSGKPAKAITFGTDDVKNLHKSWAEPDNRAKYNVALHQTANAAAKRAFLDHLDTLEPGVDILVTNGGCGAGKGYALGKVPEAQLPAAAIWDSAGDQNGTENTWIMKEAEARGLKATFAYVHNDPYDVWANETRGVVFRANDPKDGRMVDADVFVDSYVIGASNFKAFQETHKDNPSASFLVLENKGTPKLLDSLPDDAHDLDRDHLYQHAQKVIADRQDTLRPSVVRGAMIGQRIWSKKHGKDNSGVAAGKSDGGPRRPGGNEGRGAGGAGGDGGTRNHRDASGAAGAECGRLAAIADLLTKAFCPTGEGGGVDNSCGGEGGEGSSSASQPKMSNEAFAAKVQGISLKSKLKVRVTRVDGTVFIGKAISRSLDGSYVMLRGKEEGAKGRKTELAGFGFNVGVPADFQVDGEGPKAKPEPEEEAENEEELVKVEPVSFDSLPTPPETTTAPIRKAQDAAVERLANKAGVSAEKLKADFDATVVAAVARAKVFVAVPPHTLEKVLVEGRYKSQFETEESYGGDVQVEARRSSEEAIYGIPQDSPDKDRPVYGYMSQEPPNNIGESEYKNNHTSASVYGKCIIEVADHVRDRSTLTFGDSLNQQEGTIPSPVNAPSFRSANFTTWHDEEQFTPPILKHGTVDAQSWEGDAEGIDKFDNRFGDYTEVQIHKGLPTSDIKAVWFQKTPPEAMQKLLKQRGIKWQKMK